ncbi:MAG: translation initiation factor IF-3 [Myxococcota bacterium]
MTIRRTRQENRPSRNNYGQRVNERIRVPEVRVIGSEGEMLGVLSTDEARRIARQQELDLVEVNPKVNPPVCKIMDHGRYKYEEKKRQSEARRRQSYTATKEVKLRPKTDDHDVHVKIRQVLKFLTEGNKVKITVRFRGREITHPETAERQINTILDSVEELGVVEQGARMEGRTMTAIVAPKRREIQLSHRRSERRVESGETDAAEGSKIDAVESSVDSAEGA